MIRYRTRDLTSILPGHCPCGRTLRRMARVKGRTDDMLIIKGVNVFPSQIESVLFEIEGTEPHYQIVIDRKGGLDEVTVHVEVGETIFFDQMRRQRDMMELIRKQLAQELGISVEVKLVEKKTLARSEGKSQRVVDLRTL
jgi:phenylacetate-CoA ligase